MTKLPGLPPFLGTVQQRPSWLWSQGNRIVLLLTNGMVKSSVCDFLDSRKEDSDITQILAVLSDAHSYKCKLRKGLFSGFSRASICSSCTPDSLRRFVNYLPKVYFVDAQISMSSAWLLVWCKSQTQQSRI